MVKEGIYEEIINEKLREELIQLEQKGYLIEKEAMDVEEARKILATYISSITRKALKFIRENKGDGKEALLDQIRTCNDIILILSHKLPKDEFDALKIAEEGQVLTSIYSSLNNIRALNSQRSPRPISPLSQSSLFTGSHYEPSMLEEMKREILSADAIDMLVSFIKWSGLRCIIDELQEFTNKKGKLRIITTSYMEATDFKAILELSKLENTEIKVSYDVERTRLHAKAYLFKRETGFSTAYIGSSNISNIFSLLPVKKLSRHITS